MAGVVVEVSHLSCCQPGGLFPLRFPRHRPDDHPQSWSQGVEVWDREGLRKLWSASKIKVYGGVAEAEFLNEVAHLVGPSWPRHHFRVRRPPQHCSKQCLGWVASTTPKSVPPTQPTTPPNAQPRRIRCY
ncbi:TraM recognition domain-containing protein [Pseudarthrobacter oxydans]|uniref:TraM recognition domain-containing protein n=1 Tax=Pseudarthrobacter oxydans TaxID=1671 RepID=UPI003432D72F